jgi:hypothetical protein
MKSHRRLCLALSLAFLFLAATAGAEAIFPVNESGAGTWTYDQPATASNGSTIQLAFIGDSTGSGQFRLYYAAVAGGANFASKTLVRSQVIITAPTVIDNGALYSDARHPQIVLISSTELVIVFQAVPSGLGAGDYRLFRALLTLDNNAVKTQLVSEILNANGTRMAGPLVDPSFRTVSKTRTLCIAYASNPGATGDVYYARVGTDNSLVVGSPILLSSLASSRGVQPLPRLRLDSNNFSHIVWAANNTAGTPSGIYYSMVKADASGLVDTVAIGPTQVLYGGFRWGFPNLLVLSTTRVWVLAAEEPPAGSPGAAGPLGITAVNPYGVTQDGNPVNISNTGANSNFFLTQPGGSVLPTNFDVYHPEVAVDSQSRGNVAGYGFTGTPGRYYTMGLGSVSSGSTTASTVYAAMAAAPVPVGLGDIAFATQLAGDYTRPAFIHFNGKAVQFWSGPDNVIAGARNVYVTSVADAFDPETQSGCSVAGTAPGGGTERIPEAALLLLPAVALLIRRAARKAFGR